MDLFHSYTRNKLQRVGGADKRISSHTNTNRWDENGVLCWGMLTCADIFQMSQLGCGSASIWQHRRAPPTPLVSHEHKSIWNIAMFLGFIRQIYIDKSIWNIVRGSRLVLRKTAKYFLFKKIKNMTKRSRKCKNFLNTLNLCERSDSVCVCVSWILLTWIEKHHPPRDTNSDRMLFPALSHSLLSSSPPPNLLFPLPLGPKP